MLAAAVEVEQNQSDALDAARLIRSAAAATLEGAVAACRRAEQQSANANARLARYGNLDDRIARSRAEMVKRDLHSPLPDKLLDELEQRNETHEEVRQSAGALEVLEAERAAAEKALQDATQALSVEVINVMLGEAAALADEARAAYRRIFEISDSVVGLDLMINAAAPTLPPDALLQMRAKLRQVLEALQQPKRPYVPGIATEQNRRVAAAWRERHSELMK